MDLSKYAALFLAESSEHLRAFNSSLLEWEGEPAATEPVDRLFRAIHTIKGMAATMGYAPIAQLAHAMENLLDGLRQGRLSASAPIFQLLFRAVDALGQAVEGAAAGAEGSADPGLLAELDGAAAPSVEQAPTSGRETAPPPVPVEPKARRASDA